LLMEPFSWAALKRTLKCCEIAIEDVGRFLGLASTCRSSRARSRSR